MVCSLEYWVEFIFIEWYSIPENHRIDWFSCTSHFLHLSTTSKLKQYFLLVYHSIPKPTKNLFMSECIYLLCSHLASETKSCLCLRKIEISSINSLFLTSCHAFRFSWLGFWYLVATIKIYLLPLCSTVR